MGHEYIEMKNSNAAIEAYRRAAGMYHSAYHLPIAHLFDRREPERLPSVVWSSTGIRAFEHASVRTVLFPESDYTAVRLSPIFPQRGSWLSRPYDVRLWQGQSACYEELGRYVVSFALCYLRGKT